MGLDTGAVVTDLHYNCPNPDFRDECNKSLNHVINAVVDVPHTLQT